jgi:hypothetical protein
MKKNKLVVPFSRNIVQFMLTLKFITLIIMISLGSASAETFTSTKENPVHPAQNPAQQAQRREIRGTVKDASSLMNVYRRSSPERFQICRKNHP